MNNSGKTSKSPKSKLRRELIIDAAYDVLVDEGYTAVTVTNVAKHAGISPSHLQYYFRNAQEIISATNEQVLNNWEAMIEEAAFQYLGKEPPLKVLDRLLKTHIRLIKKNKIDLMIWETQAWAARNKTVKLLHEAWVNWYTDHLSELIREINPEISRNRSYRLAAIISTLLDNIQRFLGASKPKPARFRGLEKEIRHAILSMIYQEEP